LAGTIHWQIYGKPLSAQYGLAGDWIGRAALHGAGALMDATLVTIQFGVAPSRKR